MRSDAPRLPVDAAGVRYQCGCFGYAVGWSSLAAVTSAAGKRVELYTSIPMLAELIDILNRRKFEKKIAASLLSLDQLVDRYAELAQIVRPKATARIAPDPDDNVVIGTALAATAYAVMSHSQSR